MVCCCSGVLLPAPLHNVELFGRAPIKKKGSSMIKQLLKIHLARFGCGPWRMSALNLNVSNLFCTNCFESQLIHVHFQSDIWYIFDTPASCQFRFTQEFPASGPSPCFQLECVDIFTIWHSGWCWTQLQFGITAFITQIGMSKRGGMPQMATFTGKIWYSKYNW
jgi:hypothetical protein